jgi:predicted metal-dependent hydrolase
MTTTQEKAEFKSRVREWAKKLDVPVRSLTLRPMRNKWASCSTAGNLTFDIALLGLEPELREYVIVHELLHLSVPNHGRLWTSLMHAHLGDYECLHERLRESATFLAVSSSASGRVGERTDHGDSYSES